MNTTKIERKEKAIELMKKLDIYKPYIKGFKENGELCESEEMISPKAYEKLKEMQEAPILVYGERAIFDRKKFDSEFENK